MLSINALDGLLNAGLFQEVQRIMAEPSDAEKLIDNLSSMVEHRNRAQRNSRNLNSSLRNSGNTNRDSK
jgi:hypothetical protein